MTTSTSTSTSTSAPTPQEGVWSEVKPYFVPVAAASVAIVPTYYDFAAKTALQLGETPARMSLMEAMKGGARLSPVVATLVGSQMCLQSKVEQVYESTFPETGRTWLTLAASATVGGLSSPVVAVFNDQLRDKPFGVKTTLSKMSLKTACAISLQETGFVAGLAAAEVVSVPMKQIFGDNKGVEYLATAVSGACGGLAGHPGNTALTRWQNNMQVENVKQLTLGSFRRARGCAIFSVAYKFVKEAF